MSNDGVKLLTLAFLAGICFLSIFTAITVGSLDGHYKGIEAVPSILSIAFLVWFVIQFVRTK